MFTDKTKINIFFSLYLQDIVTVIIAVVCLTLSLVFPAVGIVQMLTKNIFFLIIVPVLYIKYIRKENLKDFGLNLRNKKIGIIGGIIMLAVLALISFAYTQFAGFQDNYQLPGYVVDHFWYFVFYELVFVNFFLFIYDFFFRGFILFSLTPKFGLWAVLAQAVIFWSTLLLTKNFTWALAPTIILAPASGILTYKSKSFIYSYTASIIFMIFLDAYLIHSIK
jgi:membrane protease YdiL (CAAX protease family)